MRPADLQLGLQIRQHEARILEIEHHSGERLARLGELDRLVERLLRRGLDRDRDRQPLLRQLAHQIDEALALFAQAIGDRHADVLEKQLRRIGGILPDLVELAALLEAIAVAFDQDDRHALPRGLRIGVGLGDDQGQIGVLAVGDIGLGAVDDVVIAVLLGARADRLQVAAGARFGHGDGGDDFARDHLG